MKKYNFLTILVAVALLLSVSVLLISAVLKYGDNEPNVLSEREMIIKNFSFSLGSESVILNYKYVNNTLAAKILVSDSDFEHVEEVLKDSYYDRTDRLLDEMPLQTKFKWWDLKKENIEGYYNRIETLWLDNSTRTSTTYHVYTVLDEGRKYLYLYNWKAEKPEN